MTEKPTPKAMPAKRKLGERETNDNDRRADRRWATLRKLALTDRPPRKYYV